MKRFLWLTGILALALAWTGCGGGSGGSSSGPQGNPNTPQPMFITGEDAPLPSVISFQVTLNSITLNNSSSSVTALSTATTVDFARLVGMRSLLGFNSVAPGTYTSATFTLANPVIYYLNTATNPPTVSQAANASLSSSTVTVSFPTGSPLVVSSSGLAGLHMDFDLRKSLAVDGTGQITGVVNPTIYVTAVKPTDEEGQITDFAGGLVSVNSGGNSFVMQGPYGFQMTVDVNTSTQFNPGWSLSSMATPEFVAVEGTMQADGSILASVVEVISTTQAFISGRILAVNPGPQVTMFVAEQVPTITSLPVDSVQTIDLSQVASDEYKVCFFENWITQALFNANSLVAGQRIFVGGTYSGSTFTPQMVSLRLEGVVGDLTGTVNVVSGNQGSFQLNNNFLLGYVLGAPLDVQTGNLTNFVNINGLAGLQTAGQSNLVVGGLIFKDLNTGNPQMWAGRVRVLP